MTGRRSAPVGIAPDPVRRTIEAMAAYGISPAQIARAHGMTRLELEEHFAEELATGKAKADARVVEALFKQAIGGNVAAASFWCKTRLGWRERSEHGGGQDLSPLGTEVSPRDLARQVVLLLHQAELA